MSSYRVVSSDSHVYEPPDLWTARMEPRFRERPPRIVRIEGFDHWWCEGLRLVSMAAAERWA